MPVSDDPPPLEGEKPIEDEAPIEQPCAWIGSWDNLVWDVHLEGGPGRYEEGPTNVSLDVALMWARERSPRVLIHPRDADTNFNAGSVDTGGFPRFELWLRRH